MQAAKDRIALADCELNAHTVSAARLATGSVIQAANWALTGSDTGTGYVYLLIHYQMTFMLGIEMPLYCHKEMW
jgi:hypothetical protein